MNKSIFLLFAAIFLGVGCTDTVQFARPIPYQEAMQEVVQDVPFDVVLPVQEHTLNYLMTRKGFGQYVEDRFDGYHVGLDIEVDDSLSAEQTKEIPVFAIADGTVLFKGDVSGYGGVLLIAHKIDGETINAVYGHIDSASTRLIPGIDVHKGNWIAYLGEDQTSETDGERQHLHFGLYRSEEVQLAGYVSSSKEVEQWMNPIDFFQKHGHVFDGEVKKFSEYVADYPTAVSKQFPIDFTYPNDWGVEYVPSLNAINLYELSGDGIARERSQIFIRYFDASDFLTLGTVMIHSTQDLFVGEAEYSARRYDIEKKTTVANFADQPSWRNARHFVTDFRSTEGMTRYYVVAANPELDTQVYERILKSMLIK